VSAPDPVDGLGDLERSFLTEPPVRALARIATVDSRGRPHVVPGGWGWDPDAGERGELVLGGRNVPATARAAHVRATGWAAVTIDGIRDTDGWQPWALLVRGPARVDEEAGEIRLCPDRVRSWGLEGMWG